LPADQHDHRPCVVVTGAAGFIGSHLVDTLLAARYRVIGIDDFDPWYDPQLKRDNLATAARHRHFRLVEGHIGDNLDGDDLVDLLSEASVVFHLAGRPGVQDSWGQGFSACTERNVLTTQRVYEAALAGGVDRVVYASSSSVYGASSARDGRRSTEPVSPYGVSKLAGEQLAGVYRARGLAITALRYFTVYGPRQRPDMAMNRLFRATEDGGPTFVLRGDGAQRREFTHVSDVVAATIAAANRPQAANATIDIGGGSSVALDAVIGLVEEVTGASVRLRQLPPSAGDPAETTADSGDARLLLGWKPMVSIEDGLVDQWNWHRPSATPTGRPLTAPPSTAR
jgi:UDP-glucose 4-epimerase